MERHEYLKLFHDIGQADYDLLTQNLKTKTFKKGDIIIVSGQVHIPEVIDPLFRKILTPHSGSH